MKVRGDFLGPPRSTDKTTLINKVSKGAKPSFRLIFSKISSASDPPWISKYIYFHVNMLI